MRLLAATLPLLLASGLAAAAEAPAPTVVSGGDIEWHASGSLPPGAEYHLVYEEPKTHAVELLVRMPSGYTLPPHRHTYDETIYVLKGKVVLGFGEKETAVAAGGYAVIPAETVFSMKISGFGGTQFVAFFNGPFDAKPAQPLTPKAR